MAGAALNKVLLIGNLVRDPELKYLPNGTPKCELRIATSRQYTTNGEKREDTCFVDVIAWSRTAENCNQYLKKGSKIFVEGRLDYQEWEAQDGSKRSKHQVSAVVVQFLDSRSSAGNDEGGDLSGDAGGAPRSYQRNNANRGSYAPRPSYAPPTPDSPAHTAPAPAPTAAAAHQETGLAPKSVSEGKAHFAAGEMSGAMGIADDDIPF